ncbi:hypothetical protein Amet_1800 [Alkaliphilus metalliredigens QYMF]|uniref:Chemotaxis methyl-accepting receptor HlyB-like 4HB MCP domain-containing protein n=1 Tax=Alkaliphilus metalliredigens (strain QYMF) TaxID=293826 RepID=A6TP52_ALKMQ|nr:hypothetical protein [Alkaliphilus metalliredigens]ABR47970.1 hypothetical protein Amet_1800 [Alkaliphilus metalliredigens QYMF]
MTNNFLTGNRIKILIGILVISLLANIFLFAKFISDEKITRLSANNNYTAFFSTLMIYSDSLDYLANNDLQFLGAGERELQALYGYSFNLVEHARTYGMLSDKKDELPSLIWNFAIHMQDITNNLNQVDIKNNRDNLKEFSRNINGIVMLENQTRGEMYRNNKGFVAKEMHTVLSPKVEKIMDLYLSNE